MKRKSEAGQALVFTAVGLVVLMGFAGLAIDMGVMRYEKRLQQTAADAAAIAGANNLEFPASGGVTAGALSAAATNGFTDTVGNSACPPPAPSGSVGTVMVTICAPPSSSDPYHAGQAGYVEAWVTEIHSTYFMKVLGVNSEAITARAVATNLSGGAGNGCLYSLGPPTASIEGVNINGSAILNATTCGIVDNGNFNTKGNKLIVNADTFGIAGGPNQSGPGGTVTCTAAGPCPTLNMPTATDPLSSLTPPCSPCTGGTSLNVPSAGGTINPGTYSSISINGGNVTFNPGTYIINGTGGCPGACLNIPGNAAISGSGVTLYFTNGATINITGTPDIQLSPPTSGTYAGILMYQDPADTNTNGPRLGGDNGSNFTGALYFPSDNLTFFGNNTSFSVGMVVTDSFSLSGNPTVNLTGNVGLGPGVGLVKNAVLVE